MRTTDCVTESSTEAECREARAGLRVTAPCKVHVSEQRSGEAGDSGRYVAGWNMAGYLPETDPETFDTLDEAYAYLHETLEQWLEQDEQPETMTAAGILERGADYVDGWYDRNNLHLWAQRIEDWRIVPPISQWHLATRQRSDEERKTK